MAADLKFLFTREGDGWWLYVREDRPDTVTVFPVVMDGGCFEVRPGSEFWRALKDAVEFIERNSDGT